MARLIRIHEIDEFTEIKMIPMSAISPTIVANIRQLREKEEMESFMREILYDPNETPHGPTEIADILTTHLHIRGNKQLAAFVLKGKGLRSVSSRHVTHQFAKLRQLRDLGLMIFGAVAHIQDDAQRDFIQVAIDAKCHYLIMDAHDWARLLIAYEKVCPDDGTPYDCEGRCRNGHLRGQPLPLRMEVKEDIHYTIVNQKDLSHASAKRYSATVLLDRHYPRDVIRSIIGEVTDKLKCSNYYSSERHRTRWGETPAQVVWLFVAHDLEDIQVANWICRTCWIDPLLREDARPLPLNGNEKIGEIDVFWNDDYKTHRQFLQSKFGTKEEVIDSTRMILQTLIPLAEKAMAWFQEYKKGIISEKCFLDKMQSAETTVSHLYAKCSDIPMPPEDCRRYDDACQQLFATVHDLFLYHSQRGLETWDLPTRDLLTKEAEKRFCHDREKVRSEERKLH